MALERCLRCGARAASVCSAVEDADSLAILAHHAHGMVVEAGQCFIDEEEPARFFFNVTAGTAKLFKLLPDGRRQIIGFAGVGAFLGLTAAEHHAFGAEAVERMELCRFDRKALTGFIHECPEFEHRLLVETTREIGILQAQVLLLGRKTARERLATFLVQRQELAHGSDVVRLPMTRTDIADHLGLTIETVSRTFGALRKAGLIVLPDPHSVKILDGAALRAIAFGEND